MIAALLLLQATAGLDALPRQALPARGCAAYLWSVADRRFVAMVGADPAGLRLSIDGKVIDATPTGASGAGDYGFAGTTTYAGVAVTATLEMTIVRRAELTAGAAVPSGTLTVARPGGDTLVVPVAGLIGCAADQSTR